MHFDTYHSFAKTTAIYPKEKALEYLALGLCGESGEVAEKIKKIIRDKNGQITQQDKEAIIKELGDVLWYVANLADELGYLLSGIASLNLIKLKKRKREGKIKGNGDNR